MVKWLDRLFPPDDRTDSGTNTDDFKDDFPEEWEEEGYEDEDDWLDEIMLLEEMEEEDW